MNRLTKIVLKNLHLVPGTFSKIYWYAAHPDKYSKVQKMKPLRRILEKSKETGNIEIKVYGRENIPEEDGFIFYPNHQGIFDGFAMIEACPRPISPVMKKELIQEVSRRVQQGENWVIFPEGTRSRNGNQVQDFKGGSFKAALKAKCPIVPVALIDSYKPFDKNEPGRITVQVHILTPIVYEEYKDMKTAEIAETVRGRIVNTIEANENK